MRLIYGVILSVCISLGITNAHASGQGSIVEQADSAYNETAYSQALELYKSAVDSLGASTDLYYNIGNTYYRMGDLGHAILWYERALQLDPTNDDARINLSFVNTRIADKVNDDTSLIGRATDKILNAAHPNTWAWITLTLFVVSIIMLAGYLITRRVRVRKVFFFGGGFLLVLTAVSLGFSIAGASRSSSHDRAIILSPAAQLSTAPRTPTDTSTQAFLLHEGTGVQIIDSVVGKTPAETWYEVKVAGNSRAWINGADIERL